MTHLIGDEHEAAMWFRDDQTVARDVIRAAFRHDCEVHGLIFSPIEFEVREGEGENPPEPGLKLLVGRAKVVKIVPVGEKTRGFIDDLDWKDHLRLREATKQAYRKLNPGKDIDDAKADYYINMVGPDVLEKELKKAVDEGRV